MRLGQLARKLSLRPSQLMDLLASNNIPTEEGSNTRLTDEHTELIVQHFAPDRLEEMMRQPAEEAAQPEPEPAVEEIAQTKPEQTAEESVEQPVVAETEELTNTQTEQEVEVIRVQKIELSGLKVLGKIELPEPKKKEPKDKAEEVSEDNQPKPRRNSAKHSNRGREQRPWRNPVQVQRDREAREEEEKRRAALEHEKEKRKHHYLNKVKQVKQPRRTKPAKEVVTVKKPVDTRPVPKTWVGKFLRWWTT